MISPPRVVDAHGQRIPLDQQLGSGGEGSVYALPYDVSRVAKVYNSPPSQEKVEKLKTMISLGNSELRKVATWPIHLLFHENSRQPAGFVMPRLIEFQEIWHLYHPLERYKFFPDKGWAFQVRAAKNLAAAFDEVHKAGCVVGDVQLRNAHVSKEALVRLVDCDSFQVSANGKRFLCDVGLPHYIPPELQGKSLRGLLRTENHDRFGLAVLIYQLLFVGNHPYRGLYHGAGDPSFEQLIADFRFAQGPAARSWGMSPPPYSPTFEDIPPDLGLLFRSAFERGSERNCRPRAAEWIPALEQLERNIAVCSLDKGHQYWRGARKCVWCRLAENGGPEYYFGADRNAEIFRVDEGKLDQVLRRLAAVVLLDFPYDRRRFMLAKPPCGEPRPEGLEEHHTVAAVLAVVAVACLLLLPLGFVRAFFFAIACPGILVFGSWLAIHLSQSPWHREYRRRRAVRDHALRDLNSIENEWGRIVQNYQRNHNDASTSVRRLVSECRDLGTQHQAELQRKLKNAESEARIRHLRLHLLADAEIPKIGAGRKQSLAENQIFTAAEVEERKIRAIKGFGDVYTSNLLAWKADVLAKFRFDPARGLPPTEQSSITAQFRTREQRFHGEIDRILGVVESLSPACRAALQSLVPKLSKSGTSYQKREADLNAMH